MKIYYLDLLQRSKPLIQHQNYDNLNEDSNLYATTAIEVQNNVLSIGNFDGVHLGHQTMLDALKKSALELQYASMVMVFEPQPREYFAQLNGDITLAPPRLTSKNEKLKLLKKFGVEIVVVAAFNKAFQSLSAQNFAQMLIDLLNVKALVLGDDFKFGHDRSGDSQFLINFGLPVVNLPTITDNAPIKTKVLTSNRTQVTNVDSSSTTDIRISSTRIRELLQQGNLYTANRLLGYDYTITGTVVRGDAIGRTLNFPTANVELNRAYPALHGVFGVDVVILDDAGNVIANAFESSPHVAVTNNSNSEYNEDFQNLKANRNGIKGFRAHSLFGTANIGVRPSIDKPNDWRLEVYFPNFFGDLYGKIFNVRFLHFLHGERQYNSLDELKEGINNDVDLLLKWHSQVVSKTS